ncbi:hypothetical protein HF072_05705 [Bacillus sp. RO3]|nr:hypothetical protein [Bacillus sp. RO3]
MKKFILLNANRLSLSIMSFLLIKEVISLVKEQSPWNYAYVVMVGISWAGFLFLSFSNATNGDQRN